MTIPTSQRKIPISFLHKGQRFVAIRTSGKVLSGVAAMDGWDVSEVYGFRESVGRIRYGREYINALFDGKKYWDRTPGADNRGTTLWNINDTIYDDEGWDIYVTPDDYSQYLKDVKENKTWWISAEQRKLETQRAALLAKIDELTAQVNKLGV